MYCSFLCVRRGASQLDTSQLRTIESNNRDNCELAAEWSGCCLDRQYVHPIVGNLSVQSKLLLRVYAQFLFVATTYYCPASQIWSTQGHYAACCNNVPYVECPIAVSCLSTSLLVGPNGEWTSTCSGTSSETVCVTGLVYIDTTGTVAVTNAQCWSLWAGGPWVATHVATGDIYKLAKKFHLVHIVLTAI